MKKTPRKLKLDAETVRTLRPGDLKAIAGGYPTQTEVASGCFVTLESCRGCD